MSAVNPYAPPRARVADVYQNADEFQPVKTWSAEGRVGRLRYLTHLVVSYLIFAVVMGIASAVFGAGKMQIAAFVVIGVAGLIYFVYYVLKNIQRTHDMNWSGWWSILALIPVVQLIWILVPGTDGSNRYGAPPPPNSLAVKIIGGITAALTVVGTVAIFAVAVPAYKAYVQKAKMTQVQE